MTRCYLMIKQPLWIKKRCVPVFFHLPVLSGLSSSSGCGQSPIWRGPRRPRPGNCSCQRCRDAKRREWASGFWGTPCEHDTVRTGKSELLLFVDRQVHRAWSITSVGKCLCVLSAAGIIISVDSYSEDLVESWIQRLLFDGCFPLSKISFVRNQVAFDIPSNAKKEKKKLCIMMLSNTIWN